MNEEAQAPQEESAPRPDNRRMWRIIVLATVGGVIALYLASMLGYRASDDTYRDFSFTDASPETETSVIIRLRQFDTLQNTLSVDVLVHPGRDLLSKDPQSVDKMAIRLSSWTPSGDLIYLHADVAPDTATTLVAIGDPDNWPFDSYTTDVIGVELFSGTSPQRQPVSAGIIVAGHINGWNIGSEAGTVDSPPAPSQTVRLTLERSPAALSFDIGLILVLLALPAAALFVAIQTLAGRTPFLPPVMTWFAAVLFSVIPLRNLLPGAPPAGAWIDQLVVLWVLLAVAAAMIMYVTAWWRSRPSN
ncbi:DUF4436 family protein [Mycobacterium sp. 2YAF39]|uniref:DUF4436 family protein n=1 Tax=Mycobacterium sp. 2YAF39 TaxID=3233033 RepID=UPI003F9D5ABA